MSIPTTRPIHIQKIERQTDGRWRIMFTDHDGQTKVITNAAECCAATLCQTDDALFVEIYFESVTGIVPDPPAG